MTQGQTPPTSTRPHRSVRPDLKPTQQSLKLPNKSLHSDHVLQLWHSVKQCTQLCRHVVSDENASSVAAGTGNQEQDLGILQRSQSRTLEVIIILLLICMNSTVRGIGTQITFSAYCCIRTFKLLQECTVGSRWNATNSGTTAQRK